MRIGLYGGAFNPIHLGHLKVITHALAVGNLDQVWVVPAWEHAFGKDMAPFDERLAMCKDAVSDVFGTCVTKAIALDLEAKYQTRYTVDLVERIKADFPMVDQLVLIIGQDNVADLPKWHRSQDLVAQVELLVVPDQGPIRSTKIRKVVEDGRLSFLHDWLPRKVMLRIEENGLYRKKGVDFPELVG